MARALTRTPSVAFSPPGISRSRRKLTFGARRVHRSDTYHESVSVVPAHDPVASVDAHRGLVQKVACRSEKLALDGA